MELAVLLAGVHLHTSLALLAAAVIDAGGQYAGTAELAAVPRCAIVWCFQNTLGTTVAGHADLAGRAVIGLWGNRIRAGHIDREPQRQGEG